MPQHTPTADRLRAALRTHWGHDRFRPLQERAVRADLAGRDSLVVLSTGAGKSVCYQLPAVVTGELTVVVSPLIALMKDQVDQLRTRGIPAASLNSTLAYSARRDAERALVAGKLRLLFVSPERLANDDFRALLARAAPRAIAIDEAHCISQWGHDFRHDYRALGELRDLFPEASVHAFTATATDKVRRDVAEQLRLREPEILVGEFDRPNLTYRVIPLERDPCRQVAAVLARHAGEAAIVYCISKKDVEDTAADLQGRGVRARAYHAGLPPDERRAVQDAFAAEECDVVVATVAFGMGIDRSNVRAVVHRGMPRSPDHYQQEAGRAGRDGLPAECVLLFTEADLHRWRYILDKADEDAPPAPEVRAARDEHLRQMARFCQAQSCRHRALVEYFGQPYPYENCGACDVCLPRARRVAEPITLAQKVLSAVARVGEPADPDHVADVLLGRPTDSVRQREHDKLPTFGLLADVPEITVRDWMGQLLERGVLSADAEGVRRAVTWDELRERTTLLILEPPGDGGEDGWRGVDRVLFDTLRRVRHGVAREEGVAPDVIFSDLTLRELARARPATRDALKAVYGVGFVKARQFGPPFLEAIAAHRTAADRTERDARRRREAEREAEEAARRDRETAEQAERDELFGAVLASPDDIAARLRFADWLTARGDVRGEFIRLQCENPAAPRAAELLREHRRAWLGRLGEVCQACEFRRGFVEEVVIDGEKCLAHAELIFSGSPVRRMRVRGGGWLLKNLFASRHLARLEALSVRGEQVSVAAAHALAASPFAGNLRELDLSGCSLDDESVRILAASACLWRLEVLALADNPLITDAGALALAGANGLAALKRVDTVGTGLTATGRAALAARFGR